MISTALGLVGTVTGIVAGVADTVSGVIGGIIDKIGDLGGTVGGVTDTLTHTAEGATSGNLDTDGLISALHTAADAVQAPAVEVNGAHTAAVDVIA
ncbi:hypothetical protein D3C80_2015280 [compost metagenome]